MKTISTFIAEEATVIRNGERQTILATDIVVGDVVQLTAVRYNHIIHCLVISCFPRAIAPLPICALSKHLRICISTGLSSPVKGLSSCWFSAFVVLIR